MLKNYGRSMKWKELAVNQTLLAAMKRPRNHGFLFHFARGKLLSQLLALKLHPGQDLQHHLSL